MKMDNWHFIFTAITTTAINSTITTMSMIKSLLSKVDYSQPHQLVAEAQQCRQRVQTGRGPVITSSHMPISSKFPTFKSRLSSNSTDCAGGD